MKSLYSLATLLFVLGCDRNPDSGAVPAPRGNEPPAGSAKTLAEARKGFRTKLTRREKANEPVEPPPAGLFNPVQYDSPAGKMAAYLTPAPKDGKKRPAIVWITGGDCNTIGDVWSPAPPQNDQTAKEYRDAGIVMMFPSLRGGNQNPGFKEGFLGEIDDVLAAADYLRKVDYVDPGRVYLGGHSTGGTVALLAAELSPNFRAVFSFGPVENVAGYGPEYAPYDLSNERELEVRSPIRWLEGIGCPTFVFEGTEQGNLESLRRMERVNRNPRVHFHPMTGFDHFSLLHPTNALVARKILADAGETSNISFGEEELKQLKSAPRKGKR